eukprot:TRINITY_DN894_c1_g1_i1.p1 TRINITY_DN894_c1_g1~~TRINITY_DN894_c1_g1_i1.p1  ORF type:complete len:1533 (+),score=377.70 TRINITY_DN894_c1_g1_i1:80-4678(+)
MIHDFVHDLTQMGFDRERATVAAHSRPGDLSRMVEYLEQLDRVPQADVAPLAEMGYSDALCRAALCETQGRVDQAAAWLVRRPHHHASGPHRPHARAPEPPPPMQQAWPAGDASQSRIRTISVERPIGASIGWVRTDDLFIVSVAPDSPAAKAGARPGWRIQRVGGRDVSTGEQCTQAVNAAGVSFTVTLHLDPARELIVRRVPGESIGLTLSTTSHQELVVSGVERDSPASRVGAAGHIGWVLTHCNGVAVSTLQGLQEAMQTTPHNQEVALRFSSHAISLHPAQSPRHHPGHARAAHEHEADALKRSSRAQPAHLCEEEIGAEIERLLQLHGDGKISGEELQAKQSALRSRMKQMLPANARESQGGRGRGQGPRQPAGDEEFADFAKFQSAPVQQPMVSPAASHHSASSAQLTPQSSPGMAPVLRRPPPQPGRGSAAPAAPAPSAQPQQQAAPAAADAAQQIAALKAELEKRDERLAAYKRKQQAWLQQRDQQFAALTAERDGLGASLARETAQREALQSATQGGAALQACFEPLAAASEQSAALRAEAEQAAEARERLVETLREQQELAERIGAEDFPHAAEGQDGGEVEQLRAAAAEAAERAEKKQGSLSALLAIGDDSLSEAAERLRAELHGLQRAAAEAAEQAARVAVASEEAASSGALARRAGALARAGELGGELKRLRAGCGSTHTLAERAESTARAGLAASEQAARRAAAAQAAAEAAAAAAEQGAAPPGLRLSGTPRDHAPRLREHLLPARSPPAPQAQGTQTDPPPGPRVRRPCISCAAAGAVSCAEWCHARWLFPSRAADCTWRPEGPVGAEGLLFSADGRGVRRVAPGGAAAVVVGSSATPVQGCGRWAVRIDGLAQGGELCVGARGTARGAPSIELAADGELRIPGGRAPLQLLPGGFARGDVVGVSVDCANGAAAFDINGVPLGREVSLDAVLRAGGAGQLRPCARLSAPGDAVSFAAPVGSGGRSAAGRAAGSAGAAAACVLLLLAAAMPPGGAGVWGDDLRAAREESARLRGRLRAAEDDRAELLERCAVLESQLAAAREAASRHAAATRRLLARLPPEAQEAGEDTADSSSVEPSPARPAGPSPEPPAGRGSPWRAARRGREDAAAQTDLGRHDVLPPAAARALLRAAAQGDWEEAEAAAPGCIVGEISRLRSAAPPLAAAAAQAMELLAAEDPVEVDPLRPLRGDPRLRGLLRAAEHLHNRRIADLRAAAMREEHYCAESAALLRALAHGDTGAAADCAARIGGEVRRAAWSLARRVQAWGRQRRAAAGALCAANARGALAAAWARLLRHALRRPPALEDARPPAPPPIPAQAPAGAGGPAAGSRATRWRWPGSCSPSSRSSAPLCSALCSPRPFYPASSPPPDHRGCPRRHHPRRRRHLRRPAGGTRRSPPRRRGWPPPRCPSPPPPTRSGAAGRTPRCSGGAQSLAGAEREPAEGGAGRTRSRVLTGGGGRCSRRRCRGARRGRREGARRAGGGRRPRRPGAPRSALPPAAPPPPPSPPLPPRTAARSSAK